MKLSHKLIMVSAAALMGLSPLAAAMQNNKPTVEAASKKKTSSKKKLSKKVLKKTNTKKTSSSKNVKADVIVLGSTAAIYYGNGKRNTNYKYNKKTYSTIGKSSKLKAYGTKIINGQLYYDIGNNNYIKAANIATVNGKKLNINSSTTFQTASTTKKTSSKKTSTKKASKKSTSKSVKLTKNAYVYNRNGKRIKGSGTLKKGSTIKYYSLSTINGSSYYYLGNGRYVKTANTKKVASAKKTTSKKKSSSTKSIKLIKNAYVYNKYGKRIKGTGTLRKGSTIKYYSTKTIKGKSYYYLGNGRYVKTANAKKSSATPKQATYITLTKNSYVYDANGNTTGASDERVKGQTYQAFAAKKFSDGKWYYEIGNVKGKTQWIKAVNAVVASGPELIPASDLAANSGTTTNTTSAIATIGSNTPLYNSKGAASSTQTFAAGQKVRVSEDLYLWVPSANNGSGAAVEFYKLASGEGYIRKDAVSDFSGKMMSASNTPEEAEEAGKTATTSDKANLLNTINEANQVHNSDLYKLSDHSLKSAYDDALSKAEDVNGSNSASILDVTNALSALTKAQGDLNGKKVQVGDLSNLTQTEADEIQQLAATVNGVSTDDISWANGNIDLELKGNNGFEQTLNVSDYATTASTTTSAAGTATPIN